MNKLPPIIFTRYPSMSDLISVLKEAKVERIEQDIYLRIPEIGRSEFLVTYSPTGADLIMTVELFNTLNNYASEAVHRLAPSDVEVINEPEEPNHGYDDGSKYVRTIIGLNGVAVPVDAYRISAAYPTGIPMIDHIQKKALCAGLRGHKGLVEDIENIVESGQKALTYLNQKEKLGL